MEQITILNGLQLETTIHYLAGLKNPYQFSQDETRNISQDAAGSFANSSYAAMRERYFLNAIEPYNNILHTLAGPLSENLAK